MRLLAKLLDSARSLDGKSITQSQELVHPAQFDVVVEAAKVVSGYNEEKQVHKSYSCALNMGFAISDLALAVKNKYIKRQCREKISDVDDFIHLRNT